MTTEGYQVQGIIPPYNPQNSQAEITKEQLEIQMLKMKMAQMAQQVGPQRNDATTININVR